jgi:histone acetyltransferase 1
VVPSSDVQLQTISSFHPKFTYPIFGEEEQIFGYRGLKINLRYNATDMRPHLSKTFSKKFRPIGETEPTDVEELLRPFLPAGTVALTVT